MAHVHDDRKQLGEAAARVAKTATSGSGPHRPMMGGMMKRMMEPGPRGSMGPMMRGPVAGNPGSHVVKAAAKGAAAGAGGSLLRRLSRHPLLMFGLGVAAGILVYKYRKRIIATAVSVGEKGKDFVLQQKETLEDIVAETQEEGEKKP